MTFISLFLHPLMIFDIQSEKVITEQNVSGHYLQINAIHVVYHKMAAAVHTALLYLATKTKSVHACVTP